jgi:hypothetical protein
MKMKLLWTVVSCWSGRCRTLLVRLPRFFRTGRRGGRNGTGRSTGGSTSTSVNVNVNPKVVRADDTHPGSAGQ